MQFRSSGAAPIPTARIRQSAKKDLAPKLVSDVLGVKKVVNNMTIQ
jgi:hypothetical protein